MSLLIAWWRTSVISASNRPISRIFKNTALISILERQKQVNMKFQASPLHREFQASQCCSQVTFPERQFLGNLFTYMRICILHQLEFRHSGKG